MWGCGSRSTQSLSQVVISFGCKVVASPIILDRAQEGRIKAGANTGSRRLTMVGDRDLFR